MASPAPDAESDRVAAIETRILVDLFTDMSTG
jgi:hypothetical protein